MRKNILVVDNNPVILKLMQSLLTRQGHCVKIAENGLTALETIKNFQPDIMFIDMVMPMIPGDKLCRIIRSMPEMDSAFLIILSAVAVEQQVDFAGFGANACIAKGPFKEVESHINDIFAKIKQGDTAELSHKIIGTENVFRRVVTEELLSTKLHFEATLNNMAEGFIELTAAGKIVYINPAAAKLIGRPEEKILSAPLLDFFGAPQKNALAAALARLRDTPITLGEEQPLILNDRLLALTLVSVRDQEQSSVLVIIQNITDRKAAESELQLYRHHLEELVNKRTEELQARQQQLQNEINERRELEQERKRLEAKLRQAHKMEALGTMAAGISHDFNNILTAVIGYAELSRQLSENNPQLRSHLDQVVLAGRRAKDLIKHILTFSRQKEQEFQPTSIHLILAEVMRLLRASTPATIEIIEKIDQNCGLVLADTTQIHQVIMNLCTNAVQAMKDTIGTLTITLKPIDYEPSTESHYLPPGKVLALAIADTGVGMDQQLIEKIFDPYFTTKAAGEGTGMGLAVVHGIVSSHGGDILVASTPGAGSTFTVLLPVAEGEQPGPGLVEPSPNPAFRGKEHILLIGPEESGANTSRLLENLGYRVKAVSLGMEGLRILSNENDDHQLALISQSLPDLTGQQLAEKIFSARPQLPVIIYTKRDEDLSGQTPPGKANIQSTLSKPFNFPLLARALREALDR